MKTKTSVLLFGCLMLVLSPFASQAATAPYITQGKSNGVMYATGGVGKDERMAMDAMAQNYNVKMVFVEAPKDYISGVKVKIEDHSGKPLLENASSGPWFWVNLPQGDYRVIASFRDHRDVKNLKVGSSAETVEFLWTSSGKTVEFPVAARKPAPDDRTMAVQKALNKEGYSLKDDGLMGHQTRAALEAFQKKNGLNTTGQPDGATLAKLGIVQK